MKVEAYFVEDPDKPFIPKGEYKATILDQQKKEADMLLKSIDGSWYTIWLNRGIEIKTNESNITITDVFPSPSQFITN